MNEYSGKCVCGSVKVKISLPKQLNHYVPRACDCDFCVSQGVAYLSDPDGKLEIESNKPLATQQQGSMQAKFLTCSKCDTVIAVSIESNNKLIGALNSNLLSGIEFLQQPVAVSPKLLSANEKVNRWQACWCLHVSVSYN